MPARTAVTRFAIPPQFWVNGEKWEVVQEFLMEHTTYYIELEEVIGPQITIGRGRNFVVTTNQDEKLNKGFFCDLKTTFDTEDHYFLAVYLGEVNNKYGNFKHVFKIIEETETAEEKEKGWAGICLNDVGLDIYSKMGISTYDTVQLEQELRSRNSKVKAEWPKYIDRYNEDDKLNKIRDILNEY